MIAVSKRENAIIVTLKSTTQMSVKSQEDCNKLLEQRKDQSNESRS